MTSDYNFKDLNTMKKDATIQILYICYSESTAIIILTSCSPKVEARS